MVGNAMMAQMGTVPALAFLVGRKLNHHRYSLLATHVQQIILVPLAQVSPLFFFPCHSSFLHFLFFFSFFSFLFPFFFMEFIQTKEFVQIAEMEIVIRE